MTYELRDPEDEVNVAHIPDFVRQGAEMLDRRRPGWHESIDLDELQMEDILHCIIGQLGRPHYGYSDFIDVLAGRPNTPQDWSIRHGFDYEVPTHKDLWIWDYLKEQWVEAIQDRL